MRRQPFLPTSRHDLVYQPRNVLRFVKLQDDLFGYVRARTDPTRRSGHVCQTYARRGGRDFPTSRQSSRDSRYQPRPLSRRSQSCGLLAFACEGWKDLHRSLSSPCAYISRAGLRTSYDMTPDQYRRRWGLPADYPMTAPNYAKKRSQLARKAGLGTQPRRKRAKA